jgi:hypothetical protein
VLLATERTFASPCYGMISEIEEFRLLCKHLGAWRRVIDSPPNDTGDKLVVSGESNRMIAGAINGAGVADLVDLGFLARQTIYADQPPDLSGVSIVNGDYDVAQIAAIVSRSAIVGDAVEHCARLYSGRPRTGLLLQHKALGAHRAVRLGEVARRACRRRNTDRGAPSRCCRSGGRSRDHHELLFVHRGRRGAGSRWRPTAEIDAVGRAVRSDVRQGVAAGTRQRTRIDFGSCRQRLAART